MKQKVDILIITNKPSFYKIRLYNEIEKSRKIFVIFYNNSMTHRTSDFFDEKIKFSFLIFKKYNSILSYIMLIKYLKEITYSRLIVSGWNSFYSWIAAFISPKRYNELVIESSCYESITHGLKALIKKKILSRFSLAYVPGENNETLLKMLSFKGTIKKTYGVGLYRRVSAPIFEKRDKINNFLYVGRLAHEKNLFFLIEQFNKMPEFTLTIIGFGPLESELKKKAKENIIFIGEIKNKDLPEYYRKNDILVLPSTSEPWGLVVEEALNNGIPVIVSNKVGCINEVVVNQWNGMIYDNTESSFMNVINEITKPEIYNKIRMNVCSFNYEEREKMQVNVYL